MVDAESVVEERAGSGRHGCAFVASGVGEVGGRVVEVAEVQVVYVAAEGVALGAVGAGLLVDVVGAFDAVGAGTEVLQAAAFWWMV